MTPMQTLSQRSGIARAAAWSAGLAVLWLLLALTRPSLVFHLGPLLVTAAAPVLLSLDESHHVSRTQIAIATAIGAALALLTTAILGVVGRLDAPGFGPFPDALVEALILVALGAVIGLAIGWWRVGSRGSDHP